jgi:hypothetical protein
MTLTRGASLSLAGVIIRSGETGLAGISSAAKELSLTAADGAARLEREAASTL